MLTIHSTNQLSSDEKKQVMSVFKACQQVDQSHKLPYLANSFNLDQDMPCFFLAYQNDHLIGFLTVYADEWEDAELGLFVHPDYRRKGVARSLYQAFCQMAETYPIEAVSFVTEQVFLEKNPDLATVWGLEIDPGVDFLMSLPEYQAVLSDRDDVVVDLAGKRDVQAIAQFQSTVFETQKPLAKPCLQLANDLAKRQVWRDFPLCELPVAKNWTHNY